MIAEKNYFQLYNKDGKPTRKVALTKEKHMKGTKIIHIAYSSTEHRYDYVFALNLNIESEQLIMTIHFHFGTSMMNLSLRKSLNRILIKLKMMKMCLKKTKLMHIRFIISLFIILIILAPGSLLTKIQLFICGI